MTFFLLYEKSIWITELGGNVIDLNLDQGACELLRRLEEGSDLERDGALPSAVGLLPAFGRFRRAASGRADDTADLETWLVDHPFLAHHMVSAAAEYISVPLRKLAGSLDIGYGVVLDGIRVPLDLAVGHYDPRVGADVLPRLVDDDGDTKACGSATVVDGRARDAAVVLEATRPDDSLAYAVVSLSGAARVGDVIEFDDADVRTVLDGEEAPTFERAVRLERIGVLGARLGLLDRVWSIGFDALAGARADGQPLGAEQDLELRLADLDIARAAVGLTGIAAAVDAEAGRLRDGELAADCAWTARVAKSAIISAREAIRLLRPERDSVIAHAQQRVIELGSSAFPEHVDEGIATDHLRRTLVGA